MNDQSKYTNFTPKGKRTRNVVKFNTPHNRRSTYCNVAQLLDKLGFDDTIHATKYVNPEAAAYQYLASQLKQKQDELYKL